MTLINALFNGVYNIIVVPRAGRSIRAQAMAEHRNTVHDQQGVQ